MTSGQATELEKPTFTRTDPVVSGVVEASAVAVGPLEAAGPFLRPARGDLWEQCSEIAAAWRAAFRDALDRVCSGAEVLTSDPGDFPLVVSVKAWMPAPTAASTLRCAVRMTFQPRPGKERSVHVSSWVQVAGRKFARDQELTTWDLEHGTAAAGALVDYIVGRSALPPPFFRSRWQPGDWFRKNRWVHVEADGSGAIGLVYLGLMIPVVQIVAMVVILIHGLSSFLRSLRPPHRRVRCGPSGGQTAALVIHGQLVRPAARHGGLPTRRDDRDLRQSRRAGARARQR